MLTDALNPSVVKIELNRVFFEGYDGFDKNPGFLSVLNGKIFKVVNPVGNAFVEQVWKGTGYFKKMGEIQQFNEETPIAGYKRTTLVSDFGNSVPISYDFYKDDQHSATENTLREFGTNARATQELNGCGLFRGAFGATLTSDGSAWISSHTTLSGAVVSNVITAADGIVNPPLTASYLFDGAMQLQRQINQAGVALGGVAKYLIVPSTLYKHAYEITESEQLADTANNNVNIYSSKFRLELFQSHFLTSAFADPAGVANSYQDTYWFLLTDMHSVQRLLKEGLVTNLRDWTITKNRMYDYQAFYREEYFVTSYWGSAASKGTSVA